MVRGSVKEWNHDLGWGVLVSPDVPGEVWVHFIHGEAEEALRSLDAGAAVEFDFIAPPGGKTVSSIARRGSGNFRATARRV
jgi:cold shock CspA family protein